MKKYSFMLAILFAFIFIGCGGGSSSNSGETNVDTVPPVFTSSNEVSVNENQTIALTLVATDENNITYSLSGVDSDSFNIDSSTGVVTFKISPDYETKTSYSFIATASDGVNNSTQNIIVNILDIYEIDPGFIISKVTGNTASYNAIAEFNIVLKSKPSDDVTIPISSSDENEGLPMVSNLTFTTTNWNQVQSVVVKGRNRNTVNGVQDYQIILASTQSSDTRYNGLDLDDVDMKGITLNLEEPTDSTSFISGLSKTISMNAYYTGNNRLSYTLVEKPDGMLIGLDSGLISWTAPVLAEGNSYPVKVKVTDGSLFSEVSFSVVVAQGTPLQNNVQGDTLTITETSNSLNGLSLKKVSGDNLGSISLNIVNSNIIPSIPSYINKITDVFSVTPRIDGDVEIKFPQSLLPASTSIFDLKLFHYATNLKGVDDSWISVGTDLDLEGSSTNPIVVIKIRDMEGLYFIGTQEQAITSSQNKLVRNIRKANLSDIICTPFSKLMSNGVVLTTYKTQECNITGTNKSFTIEGFANTNDTGSGTHWGGSITIKDFVVWLTEVQDKFDILGLKYKSSFDVIIESRNGYGSYDGSKLHISDGYTKEDQRNTTAHEYFHHAEIETLIDGATNATARKKRYWSSIGDWIWEGMAYWFEDYFDDSSNLYPSDGVGKNPSPRILESGINKYDYDMFLLWKLLYTKCNSNDKFNFELKNIFAGVMDSSWGADTLKSNLSTASCEFGNHLGANKSSSIESALLYYQYATMYKNEISKLDENEDDDNFKFKDTIYQYSQSDWGEVNEVGLPENIDISRITSIPAYGAYSIKVNSDMFTYANYDEGHEAVFRVRTGTGASPLIVSLLSENGNFSGNSQLDGIQHRHYKTNNISEYIFSEDELVDYFITIINPNSTTVPISEIAFEIRDNLSPELEVTSPTESSNVNNRVITVTGNIPDTVTNVDRVIVSNGDVRTITTISGNTFSAKVVVAMGDNALVVQGYNSSDLTTPITKEKIVNITGVENTTGGRNALIPSRVVYILQWKTNGTDIDLYSTDKNSATIWYGNKNVSPGILDYDNSSGYGPEVISYAHNDSDVFVDGAFDIDVHFYGGSTATAYSIDVIVNEMNSANRIIKHYESKVLLLSGNSSEDGADGSGNSRFNNILKISCDSQRLCSIGGIDNNKLELK